MEPMPPQSETGPATPRQRFWGWSDQGPPVGSAVASIQLAIGLLLVVPAMWLLVAPPEGGDTDVNLFAIFFAVGMMQVTAAGFSVSRPGTDRTQLRIYRTSRLALPLAVMAIAVTQLFEIF